MYCNKKESSEISLQVRFHAAVELHTIGSNVQIGEVGGHQGQAGRHQCLSISGRLVRDVLVLVLVLYMYLSMVGEGRLYLTWVKCRTDQTAS